MIDLIKSWLDKHKNDYWRAKNVIDEARNLLNSRPKSWVKKPEPSLSAAELRDQTRPAEMDSARRHGLMRSEHVCAVWLARWLSAWAPGDDDLQFELLNRVRANL